MNKAAGLAALVFVAVVAVLWTQRDDPDVEVPNTEPVTVTYHVRGNADSVDITVETPTGTQQASDRALPLRMGSESGLAITGFLPGDFVYISAQATSDGSITCTIENSAGEVIAENTSQGEFSIATCEGSAS